MKRWAGLALALLPFWTACPAVGQETQGVHIAKMGVIVGFDNQFRCGHLVPIFVQINNPLQAPFGGELQVTQRDDDGDSIRWRVEASIRPRGQEWRMVLVCPRHDGLETVRLNLVDTTAGGKAVDTCDLGRLDDRSRQLCGQPLMIDRGRRVVGVIGGRTDKLGALSASPAGGASITSEPAKVISMPLERFPGIWQALDMVDAIYWDDPAPGDLDIDQQRALSQWVWRGGQLVVGLGDKSRGLANSDSELARLLPVEVLTSARRDENLHGLGQVLLGRQYAGSFTNPATIVAVRARGDAKPWTAPVDLMGQEPAASRGPALSVEMTSKPLLYRCARGAGSVTVLCTTLNGGGFENVKPAVLTAAFARLLGFEAAPAGGDPSQGGFGGYGEISLTTGLSNYLAGSGVGGTLIGLAVLMLLAYGLVAGPGTWLYAQHRHKRHLSWWFFGAVVGAATLASLLLSVVSFHDASITSAAVLDLPVNSSYGVLRGDLGLYVPAHRRSKVELLGDPAGRLVPMIEPEVRDLATYPDVRDYEIRQDSLTQVTPPIRRTVKQLAMDWRGEVGGAIHVETPLTVRYDARSEDWHIAGTIRNGLPVDLGRATLIYLPPPSFPGAPAQAVRKGIDTDAQWCRQVHLDGIAKGGSITFDSSVDAAGQPRTAVKLRDVQKQIVSNLGLANLGPGRPNSFYWHTVLLSTLSMFDQPEGQGGGFMYDARPVRRDAWCRLDRGDQIVAGKVLLVAETRDFMPAELRVDGVRIPNNGWTIVRVVLDCKVGE